MSRKRLQTLGDVRRYLAGLLNRYEAGEIDETHLKAAAYVSNILTSTIKDSDLEERIQRLEQQSKIEGNNGRFRAAG
ncbi:MAG: hypothetical protein HGB06_04040 [Chlorobaculum sp.]|jgi:hypothetical protein|nr:hypothetical protein [Chlorobaculum sp.]